MTEQAKLLSDRVLHVAYWDHERRVADRYKAAFEAQLKKIADVKLTSLRSLDDLDDASCDLLVVGASGIPEEKFLDWLTGLKARLARPDAIWVPVLFFASIGFPVLVEMFRSAVAANWYFDIVAPDHIDSLPLRMANLLRIRDHLQELMRYATVLDDLELRVRSVEKEGL